MLRSIIAVVVTYIVMSVLIVAAFMGMWFGLGPDRLLQPGSFQGSMLMNFLAPAVSVLAGIFGGWMCAKVGRSTKPVVVLASLVLVLGLAMAYFTLQKPFPADPRAPGMTVQQIFEVGREPTWFAIANPIIGAAAVLLGGMLAGAPRKRI
ncbi:MAG TPA: hypothetical protein PKE29_11340 [Phycisphaerales bacterium]|nr:hypothetical protein [Phycisphaerales bacterium]